MKNDKQEIAYREHLKNERRKEEVKKLLDAIPLVPLAKPVQSGWVVSIRLRDDITKRKDAPEIAQIIELGYEKEWITHTEKHVKLIRGGKKVFTYTRDKKRITVDLVPRKKKIDTKTYDALTEQFKSHFYLDTLDWAYLRYGTKTYTIHVPDFWICLKARPNMLTHQRMRGGELEKEYEFLKDKVWEYYKLSGGYSKSYPKGKERSKTRTAIRKFMKGDSDDIIIDKTHLEYD